MNGVSNYETRMLRDNSAVMAERLFEIYQEADKLIDWFQSFSLVRVFINFFYRIYLYFIVLPLFHLYIHGPSVGPIGFWSGMSYSQICAKLTNMNDPDFWSLTEDNSKRCYIMILQHFHSFWILLISILYFVLIYYAFRYSIQLITFLVRKSSLLYLSRPFDEQKVTKLTSKT